MTEKMKNIISTKTPEMKNKDYLKYNKEVFNVFVFGNKEERDEARAELVLCNHNYFYALCITGSFKMWKAYGLVSLEDAVSALQTSFIEVLNEIVESDQNVTWNSKIWFKTCDRTKLDLHMNYSEGGISESIATKKRRRNKGEESFSFISDSVLDFSTCKSHEFNPEVEAENGLRIELLSNLIKTALKLNLISNRELNAVMLRCEGYNYEEIAIEADTSEAAARKQYSRGINGLKATVEIMKSEGQIPTDIEI